MRRGDTRVALLKALQDKSGHGYELMQRLSERSGGRWRPSAGSVYPTLQALEDEGLVSSSEQNGKRVYSLTDAGQAEVAARGDQAGPFGPGGPGGGPDGGLRTAVMQLIGAARQASHALAPEKMAAVEQIVNDARRKIYEILASS
jgi:DNA-binding PadR family transcriptional regulator